MVGGDWHGSHVCRVSCQGGHISERSLACIPLFTSSAFPSSDELPRSLCQPVSTVSLFLILLKESMMHTEQLVCRGYGQGWRLRLRLFRLAERLILGGRGLGAEGVLAGGWVRAHAIHICRGGQGHCRKGSAGGLWSAGLLL